MTHLPQKTALTQWGSLKIAAMLCILAFVLSSVACTATTPAKKTMPVWPNNGIAQREFYGGQMFVENDRGKWRAWVISSPTRWKEWNKEETDSPERGEALDFFSGKKQMVYPKYTKDGHSESEFKTLKGRTHNEIYRPGMIIPYDMITVGLRNNLANLDFNSGVKSPFKGQESTCPLRFSSVLGLPIGQIRHDDYEEALDVGERAKAIWRKVILYHEPPSKDCPSGRWQTIIEMAMNLEDGTFLATTGRYVFRLRFSDLSPVGSAPALHVVDAETIEKALEKELAGSDPKTVVDQQAFFAKALHLKTSTKFTINDGE